MAVYKIFPEKDATLYSLFPQMNTGLDEILEISNLNFAVNTNAQVARYLVQFDQNEINSVFSTYVSNSTWDADFKCFIATAQSINVDYEAFIYPVSGAWGMGTGKYLDQPIATDGTSWEWRDYANGNRWATSGFTGGVTASYSGSNLGGGNWYLSPSASQTFTYHSDKDLNVNVTDFVNSWNSESISNNGFIVKWKSFPSQPYENTSGYPVEFNPAKAVQPVLQYYSVDTHTIYPPVLEIKWDDFSYVTSSTIPVIETSQLYASIINNDGFFYSQSVQQFRVDCRPQFPPIIFQTASIYTTNYYLPSGSSYWAIKDLDTNEYVIDFDPLYTQISADTTSSYFTVYMNGLQPERYYTILLKTTVEDTTLVFDSNYNFKVING
jgi:hypothetical protein